MPYSEEQFSILVERILSSTPIKLGCSTAAASGVSYDEVVRAIKYLRDVLFPGYFTTVTQNTVRFFVGERLALARSILREQLLRAFCFICTNENKEQCCYNTRDTQADAILDAFLETLPKLRSILLEDVKAAYRHDPAARSEDEIIFCYPGFRAILYYRLAHELHILQAPILPRMITEYAHSRTGIDIHPGAQIGSAFFIDHGTGVVIGETCEIGKNVTLYQGVTLGARNFPCDSEGNAIRNIKRHPILEDNVTVYAGATILGRVRIGKGAVIGGNVWLTRDVSEGEVVTQYTKN